MCGRGIVNIRSAISLKLDYKYICICIYNIYTYVCMFYKYNITDTVLQYNIMLIIIQSVLVRICVREVSLTLVCFDSSYIGMNVCGSAYENRCMVDGTCATAAD